MQRITIFFVTLLSLFGVSFASANPIIPIEQAQIASPNFTPTAPKIDAKAYLILDANTGKVLAESNADAKLPPASLTKLMSMYIVSSAIKQNSVKWDDKVRVSSKAWKTEGSKMFIKVDDEVPVKSLVNGVIVASGNDATVALAEHIAGTEEAFVDMMNNQAKALGMNNSHFMDSTGLPNPNHYTTARDLALLVQAYIKAFPEDYSLYSQKWFTYNNIRQPNRNRLLWRFQMADGLKTGHTQEAGYCLVASAKKDNMRLISIVLGAPNDNIRTEDSIRLLTYGFRFFETHKLYPANTQMVLAPVKGGAQSSIKLGIKNDFFATIPSGQIKRVKLRMNIPELVAPLEKGKNYGTVQLTLNNQVLASAPLYAFEPVQKGSLWRRSMDSIRYTFSYYFSRSKEPSLNNA